MPESRRGEPPASASAAAKVLFNKYELGRLLGRGATAKVYHARNLHTGHSVAIKCISKPRATTNTGPGASAGPSPSIIEREVSIMRRLRHPHILLLLEVLASRTKIYFVLELAKGGELFDHIAASCRLSETQSRHYFHQLISAVHYCHARGVFHRDLKPENLLLDDAGKLKVSDFGLSTDAATPDLLQTLCGTPAYVAPEILAKKGYSGAAVDVWSCGVILFVLTTGYLPFNDTNLMAMYRKIYRGQYRCPRWTSPELRQLISRLLDTNPLTRITVDEMVDDPWFRKGFDEVKWEAMKRGFDDEVKMVTEEEDERELNAFDLISYSSGLDLNGLFGDGDRERFVAAGDVVARVEELGEEERVVVRRVGGGVVVEERGTGSVVARVVVRRLTEEMVVVEVEGGEVWREKVRMMLNGAANAGQPAA